LTDESDFNCIYLIIIVTPSDFLHHNKGLQINKIGLFLQFEGLLFVMQVVCKNVVKSFFCCKSIRSVISKHVLRFSYWMHIYSLY